ncbi:nitric-oxide reductase large subunit [Anaeromyxobacter diazotrophicus]|uniref:Nitric-oxide reductase large subunit n=1 Tax=Anaeromyxobacter diazotrophicus TaxID=2590199 RepID=A0A7I9VLF1_9BACT|nr:nitric-oxide reductase large subunit [Anaeromyxobacter diazotrophicus]GEJ57018.1 nitric-oxide reductase large subunit [Anaeromyxobacter diazotrophicus]
MNNQRSKAILLFVLVAAFSVLIFGGAKINQHKPPMPAKIVDAQGQVVFTYDDLMAGQRFYLAHGGQHIGSIWGHGAYLAADWSADALHRTGLVAAGLAHGLAADAARGFQQADLDALDAGEKGRVQALVAQELRQNRYDAASDTLVLSTGQAAAVPSLVAYYTQLWQGGSDAMSIPPGVVKTAEEGRQLTAFFWWTAWAAGTNRPGETYTYTANWPYDPLVGNGPLPSALVWSIASVLLLIAGTGLAIYLYMKGREGDDEKPEFAKFSEPNPTPSQRATLPYFLVALVLFILQAALGSMTGHYAVEGNKVFGVDLTHLLPYAASRTWHLQLAVFWIATCWLATGLVIGPAVGGKEPKGQKALVLTLLGALVVVVLGALFGTWAGIQGKLGNDYLFGTQGYEYIELGRVWQVALIAGMLLWLALVYRAIQPALRQEKDAGGLTHLLLYAAVSIPLFYAVGLFYTPGSHISNADYWRWWVVHLWVENFFEVFATVALAFVLSRVGAVKQASATRATYFSIILYLGSGIIGTFHHLYFTGSPLFITALGASFSALEVVPLTLLGFEVYQTLKLAKLGGDAAPYKWPLYFFTAVAFWNMVGAGVFGFLINPPIVLYYAQGLNTTPIHSHGALFGVYGFLAIALMLFSVRNIVKQAAWSDTLLKYAFWGLNLGLAGMMVMSLIPAGFYQFAIAIKHGIWYARSPAVTGSDFIHTVTWLRVIPDVVFDLGAFALVGFLGRAIAVDVRLRRAERNATPSQSAPGRRAA